MIPALLLLPALVGVIFASSEKAKVYILPQPKHVIRQSITPTLSPDEARLVIAQRVGVSQYYSLDQISSDTLAHINTFGRRQSGLFEDDNVDKQIQLIVIADGISNHAAAHLEAAYGSAGLVFDILDPPSQRANAKLVRDISAQGGLETPSNQCGVKDAINPRLGECWTRDSRIIHLDTQSKTYDANEILEIIPKLVGEAGEVMQVMVVLMPESSRNSHKSYSSFDPPSLHLRARNAQLEEPIKSTDAALDKSPVPGNLPKQSQAQSPTPSALIFSSCYTTNETCNTKTRNCSNHGACYAKIYSSEKGQSCYTCGCRSTINITQTKDGEITRLTHWGGAACQKEDISGPFWLLFGISAVLVGVVAAGIGLLFSVGEEKLPGVIGAGVSGPKAR